MDLYPVNFDWSKVKQFYKEKLQPFAIENDEQIPTYFDQKEFYYWFTEYFKEYLENNYVPAIKINFVEFHK